MGSDPKGVNTSTGTVITIAENQAGIYEPIGRDATAKPGDAAPDPATLITNKDDLPDGTTYTWEATPDLSNEGDVPATIVVTYPDNSTDKVTINIAVTENATQAQTYSAHGGSVEKGYGETATLDELAATVTYDPALAEGLNPTIALADGASIPTEGKNNDVALVVTYPDGSKDNVTVTVSYQSAAEKYAATGSSIMKGYGETLTADELARAVTVTPDDSAVKSIAPADPDNLPTEGAVNMVPMVVTYNDGTTDTVNVAVAFGTAADKYTASAKEVIRKPIDGEVTLDDLKNNVVYSPALANADDVSDVKLADGQTLPTEGVNAVDVVVTYKDGSTDTVPMRVVFGTAAERNDPQGQNINAVMGEDAPAASTAISNAAALQDVSEIVWKETPDTSTAGEQGSTVLVKYIDGAEDEVPVKVNVIDSRADSVKYDAQGGSMTKPYGQTATLDELKAQVAFNGDAPADGTYSVALADGVTIPTSGKDNAVVLVVTYADKTTDTVTVKLSYGDASDAYTPTAQPIAADLGATPAASDGIANKGDLPAGTTYGWKGGTAPDTSQPGTTTGTVVVTYPDGSTDEVPVTVNITDTRTEAQKHTATSEALNVAYGTKVTAADIIAKVTVDPNDAASIALADGVTIPTDGKGLKVPVTVTFSDGSTTSTEVTLSYGDAADAYAPVAKPIEALVNSTPAAADGIANLSDLPAGTTVTWQDGKAPDTSKVGTTTGTALVTYPDGTTDTVEVAVTVKTAADVYDPIPKDGVTAPTGGNAPDAKDVIENMGDLPEGTKAEWTPTPDTSKPGSTTGTVTITYPDGSTDTVEVPVKVGTDAELYDPVGKDLNVPTGSELPAAADAIENMGDLPSGTTATWADPKPDTSKPGKQTGTVIVTYPDGSTDTVEVSVKVGTDAEAYDPTGKDITTDENGTLPDASDGIANPGDLPDGTTIEWKDPKPDTSKPGDYTGTIVVTYPDGSSEEITVKITVPEKSKDNGQNNGGQGNSDGNGQNTSGAKNTGGKGGRGTKGKLPKTGDASTIATGSLMGGGIIASALGSIIAAWKRRRRDAE